MKLERLCRYISCPAVAENRLSLTTNGNVRYLFKSPYRDGTTHVIFVPMDFIRGWQLWCRNPASAPNSKYRVQMMPAKQGCYLNKG
jgi:hypothetical protein